MQWLEALNNMKLPDLIQGSHPDGPEHGMCAMEMISYMERQPFSDRPEGVCEVLRGFTICVNDLLPHDERQKLKPILPMLVDTAGSPQLQQERQRLIESTVMRNFDHFTGRRESYYDYERDRMRFRGHPDPRYRDRAYQMMSQGPQGWVRLMLDVLPPWHAADILIAIIRDAVTVNRKKRPRTEFTKPKQVEKLAEVIYLPEAKRKNGKYTVGEAMKVVQKQAIEKIHFEALHGTALVDPKKAFFKVDCA